MPLCEHYQPCECERSWLEEQIIRDSNRFREMRLAAIAERDELGIWPQDLPSDDEYECVDKSGCSCIACCTCPEEPSEAEEEPSEEDPAEEEPAEEQDVPAEEAQSHRISSEIEDGNAGRGTVLPPPKRKRHRLCDDPRFCVHTWCLCHM